jgi:hypothetical protein
MALCGEVVFDPFDEPVWNQKMVGQGVGYDELR